MVFFEWLIGDLLIGDKNYIINLLENKLYSSQSYKFQEAFETPYFPSGISRDGNLILGSNNNPQDHSSTVIHERIARLYNLTNGNVTTIETEGYPHLLFENHLGQIISISSDFQRDNLGTVSPKPDIFVEVVK